MSEIVAQSRAWPCRVPAFRDPSWLMFGEERIFLEDRGDIVAEYLSTGETRLRDGAGVIASFATADIRSIEHQSLADFRGRSGRSSVVEIDGDAGDVARFIEAMGLSRRQASAANNHTNMIRKVVYAGIAFGTVLAAMYLRGRLGAWGRFFGEKNTRLLFVGLGLAITPFLWRWAAKWLGSFRRSFNYDPTTMFLVVLYLVNGRRFVLATTYRDMDCAIVMLTDHRNAWDAAKTRLVQHGAGDRGARGELFL